MRSQDVRARRVSWQRWAPEWIVNHTRSGRADRPWMNLPRLAEPIDRQMDGDTLTKSIENAAFAFRGYDASNIGRTPELLLHAEYGPVVRAMLDRASLICGDVVGQKVDLAARVLAREPSTLATFVHDIATIVAVELAQVQLLEQFFDVPVRRASLSLGHSIGELSAVVLGGVYEMEQLLPVPLALANDCADLTADTAIGILSTKGAPLDIDEVHHLCSAISGQGRGMVGPSTYLSPFQMLLLGQGSTLEQFEQQMRGRLGADTSLRRKPNRWPPLHTNLVWQRNIPNRTAVAIYHTAGGDTRPTPRVISCTTGADSYNDWNSRELLTDWTDHPQRLWEVVEHTLASGAEVVIHVGPEPKLIPTIFDRLSSRIMKQLKSHHLDRLGSTVIPSIGRNHWLARKLPGHAALLRAPFVHHVMLEDWLLAQKFPGRAAVLLADAAPVPGPGPASVPAAVEAPNSTLVEL